MSPFLFHKSILFLNQEKIQRQRSLPEGYYSHTEEKPKSIKESLLAVTGGKKFDKFRESISKFRSTEKSTNCTNQEQASLKVTFNYFFFVGTSFIWSTFPKFWMKDWNRYYFHHFFLSSSNIVIRTWKDQTMMARRPHIMKERELSILF